MMCGMNVTSDCSWFLFDTNLAGVKSLALIDPDKGRFGDNMPARLPLDLAAGGLGGKRQMIDRKRQQTKVIAMAPVTMGRARAAIARPVEVVDRLLQSCRAAAVAGAFGKSFLSGGNVVGCPMMPFAAGRVRVVAKQDETAGRRRGRFPFKRRGEVLAIAGVTARDYRATRKGA